MINYDHGGKRSIVARAYYNKTKLSVMIEKFKHLNSRLVLFSFMFKARVKK